MISISVSDSVAEKKRSANNCGLEECGQKSDVLVHERPRPALPRLEKDASGSRFSLFVFRRYREAPPCSSVITTAPIIEYLCSPQRSG
jgi:hypothetical protein